MFKPNLNHHITLGNDLLAWLPTQQIKLGMGASLGLDSLGLPQPPSSCVLSAFASLARLSFRLKSQCYIVFSFWIMKAFFFQILCLPFPELRLSLISMFSKSCFTWKMKSITIYPSKSAVSICSQTSDIWSSIKNLECPLLVSCSNLLNR